MVPLQDVPDDHKFTVLDLKEAKYPGFNDIPLGETKYCTVKLQNIPDKNKSSLVTTTTVPIQDKPLMIEYPGIGNAFSEDAKPCVISAKTVEDGKDKTFISTTITAFQDVPGTEGTVPIEAADIESSSFVDEPSKVQPGIVVSKTVDDGEPKTVTATIVTSTDSEPGLVLPQDLPKGKDKPAIITSKSTKDGDITTTVTTTMIPAANLPENYNITVDDVAGKRFPGFDDLPKGDTRSCTIRVDDIPEGNKITTFTATTIPIDSKPLLIEVPGFGNVAAKDTKPCVVSAKTITEDGKSTMVTTTVTASQEVPGSDETIPLDSKSIEISGYVESPEDSHPGTYVIRSLEADEPVTMIGTVVTSEDDTPAYLVPDDMPIGHAKPAIQTTKAIKDGDITATVTTTMVPLLDLPDDYKFTSDDVKNGRFPGFSYIPTGGTKACTVTIDNIPEDGRTNTVTTTLISAQDKSLMIEFPGFGNVATDDTQPCAVATKVVQDGPNTTMVTTMVTAEQNVPGEDKPVPLNSDYIDMSSFIEKYEDSVPGICIVKNVEDGDTPVVITGTMTVSDDTKPTLPLPAGLPVGQDKPAIVTAKSIQDGDKTTRVTTTMIPLVELPDDYKFTTKDIKDNKYPGFDSLPEGDTKPCTVAVDNIPNENKGNTITITKVYTEDKPLSINFPGFGTVNAEDAQPCVVAVETIEDGGKKTVVSTTVTATQNIPGSDVSVPLDSKVIDVSNFIEAPEESKPGIIASRMIDDEEKTNDHNGYTGKRRW